MDFFDTEPIGKCERCGCEIYNEDHIYNGAVLCPECGEYARKDIAIVDFVKAYPGKIAEYLREIGVVYAVPEVVAVLRDFREWVQEDFDRWVMS